MHQGNLNNFKVRELSGNVMLCWGKTNVFLNVSEFYNFLFVLNDE